MAAHGSRPAGRSLSVTGPAVRPEADTLNRMVRSRFTPPERESFKPARLRATSNSLNYRASNIRTKMAVVRLRRRKGAERDEKRPEVGLSRGPGGSDNLPGMAAFCGIPTANQGRKKNVPNGRTGGGKLTRRKHSFRAASRRPPYFENRDLRPLGNAEPARCRAPPVRRRWQGSRMSLQIFNGDGRGGEP